MMAAAGAAGAAAGSSRLRSFSRMALTSDSLFAFPVMKLTVKCLACVGGCCCAIFTFFFNKKKVVVCLSFSFSFPLGSDKGRNLALVGMFVCLFDGCFAFGLGEGLVG